MSTQLSRLEALEVIYSAALRLRAEMTVDREARDVGWFYDGASALNKVDTLDVAFDQISEAEPAASGTTRLAEERCDALYQDVAQRWLHAFIEPRS